MSDETPSTNSDITVVITNYNYGEFLPEAVESAIEQADGSPNVIVIDDGSTEQGIEAVLGSLPAQVKVIRQHNQGLSAARNRGFSLANTKFFLALDADDRLPPNALSQMRKTLDENPELGFCYGKTYFFGDWEGELTLPPYNPYRLLFRNHVPATCLMRADMVKQIGGFDPEFKGYEDWEFWLRALKHGWRGKKIEIATLLYRRHESTMLSGARKNYHTWYRLIRKKHQDLYARTDEFSVESDLSFLGRLFYQYFWGLRPLPARIEGILHQLIWKKDKRNMVRRVGNGKRR